LADFDSPVDYQKFLLLLGALKIRLPFFPLPHDQRRRTQGAGTGGAAADQK
jgi:hypothetical protein